MALKIMLRCFAMLFLMQYSQFLYSATIYGTNGSGVYSIDQITGQASILSSSFRGFGNEGVALEYTNGVLYGANGSGVYSIDQITGQASILSSSFRGFGDEGVALMSISSVPIPSSIWLFISGGILLTKVFKGKRSRWFGFQDYRA